MESDDIDDTRRPPLNQYHVYNFGEAAGNSIGSPAYYYPGYPTDYCYPYSFPRASETHVMTSNCKQSTSSSSSKVSLILIVAHCMHTDIICKFCLQLLVL